MGSLVIFCSTAAKLVSLTKVRLLIILEKLFTLFGIRHPIRNTDSTELYLCKIRRIS